MPQQSVQPSSLPKKKVSTKSKIIFWVIFVLIVLVPLILAFSPHTYTLNNDTARPVTITACVTATKSCPNPIISKDGRSYAVLQPGQSASWSYSIWQPLWLLIYDQSNALVGCPQTSPSHRGATLFTSVTYKVSGELTSCPYINNVTN